MARILDLCDGIVSLIRANWQPTSPDAVSRGYIPPFNLSGAEDGALLTGRKVYVFPGSYAVPELETRGEYHRQFVVSVVIIERHTDAGQPPDGWIDSRVNWVEANVFNLLRRPEPLTDPEAAGSGFVPDYTDGGEPPVGVDVVYDLEILTGAQGKAFWSLVTARYRELETV